MKPKLVACPFCGASAVWDVDNRFRPFCSERCKMADLGAWASESYRVPIVDTDDVESIDEHTDLKLN